jgi:beta-glucanase (GH16 family)
MRRSYWVIVVVLVVVLAGTALAVRALDTEEAGWKLVWSDEFDGPAVDPANWVAENDSTYGDGGGQIACLMNRPENLRVADGVLHLVARRERVPLACGGGHDTRFPQGRSFSSAHLSTKGLHDWTYGRFEVRAKLPVQEGRSKGLWPAFWARPTAGGTGEIDVLEAIGSGPGEPEREQAHQTIWYDYTGKHAKQGSASTFPEGQGAADGLHTYTTDWSRDRITWSIDGKQVYERTRDTTEWLEGTFDKPFYLRLNLAVGGSWPGEPTSGTVFPSSMDVDYVRVYQRG